MLFPSTISPQPFLQLYRANRLRATLLVVLLVGGALLARPHPAQAQGDGTPDSSVLVLSPDAIPRAAPTSWFTVPGVRSSASPLGVALFGTPSDDGAPVDGLQAAAAPASRSKDGPLAPLGLDLARLYLEVASPGELDALGISNRLALSSDVLPSNGLAAPPSYLHQASGRVVIDAVASGSGSKDQRGAQLHRDLKRLGLIRSAQAGPVVSGSFPIRQLGQAARLPSLAAMRPAVAIRHTGSVTSRGDAALRADVARSDNGVTGAGVRVGVISDSYDQDPTASTRASQDIATGDLPPASQIDILDDTFTDSPIDEGRAMMQIITDIAPGASLSFHTGFPGTATFVNAVRDLAAGGADVIVDDLGFLTAPYFQDGLIAQVADSVASEGIPFFSAAGNVGPNSYQSPYRNVSSSDGRSFHDFDPGSGVDILQEISLPVGDTVRIGLQWPQSSAEVGGPPPDTDLDIFVVNDTLAIIDGSVDPNTTAPVEFFEFANAGNVDADEDGQPDEVFSLSIERQSGPAPALVKYIYFEDALRIREYATFSSTLFGHPNASQVAAVGAASYLATPEFGVSPPIVRAFSSRGGTPIYLSPDGTLLPSVETRQKPDFVATDDADNTFFGGSDTESNGFPNFIGTSAAAPHAAGVAALMLEKDPSLTPAQIYASLRQSGVDMDDQFTTGFDAGFDFQTGFGLIQANLASPLPVDLALFEGVASGDAVVLSWTTASETGNAEFAIQRAPGALDPSSALETGASRASASGPPSWSTVGVVEGAGTRSTPTRYSFTDRSVPDGVDVVSYRLRQMDIGGTLQYSDAITVQLSPLERLVLDAPYPNPARTSITVSAQIPRRTETTLSVFDVLGRSVRRVDLGAREGTFQETLDVSSLASGLYFLRLQVGTETKVQKLQVVR